MRQVNYPSNVEGAPNPQGFAPQALNLDLNVIRDLTVIPEEDFNDEQLRRLLDPMVGQFESRTEMGIRNAAAVAYYDNPEPYWPLLVPGYAAADFYATLEGGSSSLSGLHFEVWGSRKDILLYPPEGGCWTLRASVAFTRGATMENPVPDGLYVAFASEVRKVRDGLLDYGKVVSSYLSPFYL